MEWNSVETLSVCCIQKANVLFEKTFTLVLYARVYVGGCDLSYDFLLWIHLENAPQDFYEVRKGGGGKYHSGFTLKSSVFARIKLHMCLHGFLLL